MKRIVLFGVIALAVLMSVSLIIAAKSSEVVNTWDRNFSKVVVTVDSDKVKIYFLESAKDPNDPTKMIQRCGQTINSNQASNLAQDLTEAAIDADPAR